MFDGVKYLIFLKQKKIPLHYGWGIVEARGVDEVSEVVVAPYDEEWNTILGKRETIKVDSLAVNYGFTSRTEITQQLGCTHSYHPNRGGLKPDVDKWQRSDRQSVYTAGDANGVYGSYVAEIEGKIAVHGYLIDSGHINESQANLSCAPLRNDLKRLIKFQHGFNKLSSPKEGLLTLPDKETVICRCENVTLGKIDHAIAQGIGNITKLKMATRAGMGDCQGKNCGDFCHNYLVKKSGRSHVEIGNLKPRFPLAPVTFSAFAGIGE